MRLGVFLAAMLLAAAAPSAAGPIRFSHLTACPEARGFVFLAQDADFTRPDTLFADLVSGQVEWVGGPVRGLGVRGDTAYAATLPGVREITRNGLGGFFPWEQVTGGRADADPARWPALLGGTIRGASVHSALEVWIFPERYLPLADSSRVFLADAEHPPARGHLLYDLHTRDPGGTEYMPVRNLEVRTWVVSRDSLHWAMAARLHRPDYGGVILEAIVAGKGARVETFTLGAPRCLSWDEANQLWVLLESGELHRLTPGRSAWTDAVVNPSGRPLPCPVGPPETVWAWRSPLKYADPRAAERFAGTVQGTLERGRAWVVKLEDGSWRPVWGGFLTREALLQEMPSPPVPDAEATAVPAGGVSAEGTVARIRLRQENGEAVLRNVTRGGLTATEFWWRFFPKPAGVRLAGPWGLDGAAPAEGSSVDTPPNGP